MRVIVSLTLSFAAAVVLTLAMSDQATAQGQSSTTPAASQEQQEQQVTVVGCVVRESDFRRARDAGKGGVAGTGIGVGNEFVLTNASMAGAGPAVGTAGTGAAAEYELTGPNEKQAEQFVGKRVEISGKLKAADVSAAGPTGGPTAGGPPSGVDVASKDLKLRELEITTVKASTTGTCPAQ